LPNSDFIDLAADWAHSLDLKSDGSIVGWGYNTNGQTYVPASNMVFVAVAAGRWQSLGLTSNGSIIGWGVNTNGQLDIPAPNSDFTAVAAGYWHSLGLKGGTSLNTVHFSPTFANPGVDRRFRGRQGGFDPKGLHYTIRQVSRWA
jgi:hypothetical protein